MGVYSYAIVFWETMELKTPYNYSSHEKHAKNVIHGKKRPSIPSTWPTLIECIIKEAWSGKPSSRPSFESLYNLISGEVGERKTDDMDDLSDRTAKLCG